MTWRRVVELNFADFSRERTRTTSVLRVKEEAKATGKKQAE
jgi:hypothetical protein